jgi:hypothetical protein
MVRLNTEYLIHVVFYCSTLSECQQVAPSIPDAPNRVLDYFNFGRDRLCIDRRSLKVILGSPPIVGCDDVCGF